MYSTVSSRITSGHLDRISTITWQPSSVRHSKSLKSAMKSTLKPSKPLKVTPPKETSKLKRFSTIITELALLKPSIGDWFQQACEYRTRILHRESRKISARIGRYRGSMQHGDHVHSISDLPNQLCYSTCELNGEKIYVTGLN